MLVSVDSVEVQVRTPTTPVVVQVEVTPVGQHQYTVQITKVEAVVPLITELTQSIHKAFSQVMEMW